MNTRSMNHQPATTATTALTPIQHNTNEVLHGGLGVHLLKALL
jgi:hypothetical protein